MAQARKILLAAAGSGILAGTVVSAAVPVDMKRIADSSWRHPATTVAVQAQPYQWIQAGPEDLSPRLLTMREKVALRHWEAEQRAYEREVALAQSTAVQAGHVSLDLAAVRVEPPQPLPEASEAMAVSQPASPEATLEQVSADTGETAIEAQPTA